MTRKQWKSKIKKQCNDAGTYKKHHDPIIDTLAGVLEKRDEAERQYEESGAAPVIEYTNKAGATNTVKNPALVVIIELNTQALAFWRDLGLTPAGLKKLNGDALTAKATTAGFDALIAKISE